MKFWNLKHSSQKPEPTVEQIENLERIKRVEIVEPPKKREFKLKVGMKRHEIYQELHNNVSGETSQEIVEFYMDKSTDDAKDRMEEINKMFDNKIDYSSHEVILSDGEYAIIQKNAISMGSTGIRKSKPEYYISGINDEDMYFVHPVLDWRGQLSIKSVLDHINRADEGFNERLQGDILLQFRPYKAGVNRVELGKRTVRYSLEDSVVVDYPKPDNRTASPDENLTIEMGRHILLVKNTARRHVTNDATYVVVESDTIEIMHPEHKKTVRAIPEGHFAILANQRGRRDNERFD